MSTRLLFALLLNLFLLQACSGNSFHLRKNIDLNKSVQSIQVSGLSYEHDLVKAFEEALEEAGGKLQQQAPTKIIISDLQQDKRVTAYTSKRKAREYLIFLKFNYAIQQQGQQPSSPQKMQLDRSFIYDADYALGKEEEENKIRQALQKEAARLIMLRLQYVGK